MIIKCMIVDDEPLAIKLIENHIKQLDTLQVVATCNSAIKAVEILKSENVDLLFLDIKMPGLTGIDFLKTIKNPPKTILTTAYRDYALESYELEIVDYLLKPIIFSRFFKAIERFQRMVEPTKTATIPSTVKKNNLIVVKSGTKHYRINKNDIIYVESMKDYIQIYVDGQSKIVAKYKISNFYKNLNNTSFLRVHRSFIVNVNHVTAFTVHDIEIGSIEIPIGVSYKESVLEYLNSLKR